MKYHPKNNWFHTKSIHPEMGSPCCKVSQCSNHGINHTTMTKPCCKVLPQIISWWKCSSHSITIRYLKNVSYNCCYTIPYHIPYDTMPHHTILYYYSYIYIVNYTNIYIYTLYSTTKYYELCINPTNPNSWTIVSRKPTSLTTSGVPKPGLLPRHSCNLRHGQVVKWRWRGWPGVLDFLSYYPIYIIIQYVMYILHRLLSYCILILFCIVLYIVKTLIK